MSKTGYPEDSTSAPKNAMHSRFWLGLALGVLIMLLLPLVILVTGMFNIGASNEPGFLERNLANLALNTSVSVRAAETNNPFADDPAAIEMGMTHFRDTCLLCHGAPSIEPSEFAEGLNPSAPELSTVLNEWSDGELFWLTKYGIRMTGMPAFGSTHSDEDIWHIVAFVRHLPELAADQRHLLQEASKEGHRHGGSGHPGERSGETRNEEHGGGFHEESTAEDHH